MAQNSSSEHTNLENVEHALSSAEHFVERNQQLLMIIAAIILVVVAGFFGVKRLYLAPKEKEAQAQIFVAEQYFEKDSFNMALNGDGSNLGFIQIIDEYSITKTAKLAQYYAGICYLRLGSFQSAIDHLKKFNSGDKLVCML